MSTVGCKSYKKWIFGRYDYFKQIHNNALLSKQDFEFLDFF